MQNFSATSLLRAALIFGLLPALAACQSNPNEIALRIGAPPQNALELRTLQTRKIEAGSTNSLMHAATQTLQDLGFTIRESSAEAGVLSAGKQRDAEEAGEVAGAVALSLLGAAAGVIVEPVWDKDQQINVTLVQSPGPDSRQSDVRVSFDRTVRNTKNNFRSEIILEPKIYQEFFQKLEQSVFLEKSK